jgi:hypothetical protein
MGDEDRPDERLRSEEALFLNLVCQFYLPMTTDLERRDTCPGGVGAGCASPRQCWMHNGAAGDSDGRWRTGVVMGGGGECWRPLPVWISQGGV